MRSRYVHIQGARVIWEAGIGLSRLNILWRGQLARVDGWWIGQVTDSPFEGAQ
jgi:hypothetical protein